MDLLKRIVLPLIVIALGFGLFKLAEKLKPEAQTKEITRIIPVVEIEVAKAGPYQVEVATQGNVQAQTVSLLGAEVGGRIEYVAPAFRPGGFFAKGDVLLKIDTADLRAAIAQQEAAVAQNRFDLEQERALAEQAAMDWQALGRGGEPSALVLRKPQLKRAESLLTSALALLEKAKRDLERATLRAPYDGRVLEQQVDVGQFVQPGTQLGRVYSVEALEVRLPLSSEDVAFLELPFRADEADGPLVKLESLFGGKTYEWTATITRTEGEIDSRTRFLYAIAIVKAPFAVDPKQPNRPPLLPGMFVEASILGQRLESAFVLPASALINNRDLLVASPQNRLETRQVEVVRSAGGKVIVTGGINDGDKVITTPLDFVVEGMEVRTMANGSEIAASGNVEGAE